MRDKRVFLAGLMLFALLAASCGGGESSNGDGGGGSVAGGGGGANGFGISTPEDGADVSNPFTIEFSSDDELGAPETGKMHVHLIYDGKSEDYVIVNGTSFEIDGLGDGEHTITASLRNADHSAAGPEDEITVSVSGSGSGDGGEEDGGDDDGGYRY